MLSSAIPATTADGASEFTRLAEGDGRRLNAAAALVLPEVHPSADSAEPRSQFFLGWNELTAAQNCVSQRRLATRERRQAANPCPGVRHVTDADLNPHSPVPPPAGGDGHPVGGERGE